MLSMKAEQTMNMNSIIQIHEKNKKWLDKNYDEHTISVWICVGHDFQFSRWFIDKSSDHGVGALEAHVVGVSYKT